jgi:hypothetical protein
MWMKTEALRVRAAQAVLAAVALHCLARIFYGVDFFDEAYCVSFQWRFALGDRPYLDEASFHQNFAVFLFPLVALFRAIIGNSDGLVLFTRSVFWIASMGAAVAVFRFFRTRVTAEVAYLMTAVFLLLPVSIPNFSYSMLGTYSMILGALGLFALGEKFSRRQALVAGVLHGIAAASDPSQIPTLLCLAAVAIAYCPKRTALTLWYGIPPLLMGILMLGYAGSRGIDHLAQSSRFLMHSEWTVNFFSHVRDLSAVGYPRTWAALVALAAAAHYLRYRRVVALVAAVLPIACWVLVTLIGYGTVFYFTYFGLAGVLAYAAAPKDSQLRHFFRAFWVPSLVCAISLTWAGNLGGVYRFGNGMVLAVLATILFCNAISRSTWPAWFTVACLVALTAQFSPYHGDAVFTEGPFQGLRTESARVEWLRPLASEVRAREKAGKRILFHSHFPAGYLLTSMRPASNNTWWTHAFNEESADIFLRAYRSYEDQVGMAVVVRQLYYNPDTINRAELTAHDQVMGEITEHLAPTFHGSYFDIFEAKP